MTPILHYYDLGPRVVAFSTTRQGGQSEGRYAQLNVNAYCGDAPEAVTRNRQSLCRLLGLDSPMRLVIPHQTHGTAVLAVAEDFFMQPESERQQLLEGIDVVTTDQRNVCIGVSTADCIPILIYDPRHHRAAAVHAGWRGTLARILQSTVERLVRSGSEPADLRAVIGPGISLKNFEVGDEVYEAFSSEGFCMEQIACLLPTSSTLDNGKRHKWHIDLPKCNSLQLQSLGIPAANIHDCGICTYDHADRFFSARRLGIQSGRIYTGIILR